MNTITYRDLKNWFLNNDEAKVNAKKYFGDNQPEIYRTGFYSSPSWNWGYQIGIVGVNVSYEETQADPSAASGTKWFEVVTQFGQVKAARAIYLPQVG